MIKSDIDNSDKSTSNKMHDKIERCKLDLQKDPTNPSLHERMGDLYLQKH